MKALRLTGALIALTISLIGPGSAQAAAPAPAWKIVVHATPSNFTPGAEGDFLQGPMYVINVINVGAAPTSGEVKIEDTLPEGLTPANLPAGCSAVLQTVTCTELIPDGNGVLAPVSPGRYVQVRIGVDVDPLPPGILFNEARIEGGGAAPAAITTATTISPSSAHFDFIDGDAGFGAPLTNADGSATTQAGSHPNQLTVDFGWPTEHEGAFLSAAGHLRDASADLPPGEIVNPNSTPKRCTEVQLIADACPDASQIGLVGVGTVIATPTFATSPLFNMVPPTGTASSFGFDVAGVGIFVHIVGSVRSDGDYGLTGASNDILAIGTNPVLGFRLQFWGDPSASSHDHVRGACVFNPETPSCPEAAKEKTQVPLLTAPVQCTGQPTITTGHTDDWEEPNVDHTRSYESASLAGTPVAIGGCNQLAFEPTIEAKPTTNLADSPSGLDVNVHQPQDESLAGNATAIMRDLKLALPEGMSVNPSSADGLGACAEAQANVHSLTPSQCPNEAKLGSVEVNTPLLDHPVSGALYLAKPFQNPFGSLIALYLAVNDPQTGVVANLAGRVQADPQTGQLTTTFEGNPQLPIEDVKAHLFTGPRAALRTPPTCATYSSQADITPWSTPETANAHPTDSFAIQASPNGGACPTAASQLPNAPSFTAGTIAPQAGAYSPFALKLTRPDDSQELRTIETTLPKGLIGKLAGIPYCSEADIAKAKARSHPNEGGLEKADPSCPAASEVGTLDVAAGAGITPLHTQGHAYLAGPYQGAPVSVAFITPAVAGPFDLGAVVVRAALQIDPETAQVKAISDPLPSILEGIPLDIRRVSVDLGRPNFILNPTSCDPMAIAGTLTSTLGQSAALKSPFQVGGCNALAFKPKLAIRLKGPTKRTGHPALTATATFTQGQANTKRVQVTLPKSEFLDQSHIGTVCTRVQFAANQCPAASVYGKARATSPLLDRPLEGLVYLRSSSHELPDLVVALHGQVDVVLDGRIDSVNGGIRTTFEAAPDAPVSKFTLEMQGAKKGLLINSTNLCKLKPKANRATVLMEGQNGKAYDTEPVIKNGCKKARKHRKGHKRK